MNNRKITPGRKIQIIKYESNGIIVTKKIDHSKRHSSRNIMNYARTQIPNQALKNDKTVRRILKQSSSI